jgi:hypothetical protein
MTGIKVIKLAATWTAWMLHGETIPSQLHKPSSQYSNHFKPAFPLQIACVTYA